LLGSNKSGSTSRGLGGDAISARPRGSRPPLPGESRLVRGAEDVVPSSPRERKAPAMLEALSFAFPRGQSDLAAVPPATAKRVGGALQPTLDKDPSCQPKTQRDGQRRSGSVAGPGMAGPETVARPKALDECDPLELTALSATTRSFLRGTVRRGDSASVRRHHPCAGGGEKNWLEALANAARSKIPIWVQQLYQLSAGATQMELHWIKSHDGYRWPLTDLAQRIWPSKTG